MVSKSHSPKYCFMLVPKFTDWVSGFEVATVEGSDFEFTEDVETGEIFLFVAV